MTALLVAVVLVLAVVVVMVVGLLRSHAEILRALEVVNRASRGAASGLAAGLPLAPDREGEVQGGANPRHYSARRPNQSCAFCRRAEHPSRVPHQRV